ncbi:MAG: hypothetical protein ACLPGW_02425 [Roseiarcus sp.]
MRRPLALALVVTSWLVAGLARGDAQDSAALADARNFTEAVAKLYQSLGPQYSVRILGPLDIMVHTPKGEVRAYLNTLYEACVRDRASCAERARTNVLALATEASSDRPPLQAADVRVTVRPSSYVDDLAQRGDATNFVAEPLIDDLWVIGVRDEPTTIATLGSADLKALGLTSDAALALGKRNLEDSLKRRIAAAVGRAQAGEALAMRGDDYVASLLAFPELWTPLAEAFQGELYVAAPASDTVVFADARSDKSKADMSTMVASLLTHARRPISPVIFQWTPTGWEVVGSAAAKAP